MDVVRPGEWVEEGARGKLFLDRREDLMLKPNQAPLPQEEDRQEMETACIGQWVQF